jgi:hypothetical protein
MQFVNILRVKKIDILICNRHEIASIFIQQLRYALQNHAVSTNVIHA